ncbi:hypothetical protein HR11_08500 [Porphyromonas macacae]|uniref:Esterase/lipase n=1 Tax=Porphyromonas macacae TaxID=28115 RepID=A0A379E6V6_9PORP|nr:alpha/beta fold hydrolase [Porphyromonas macacae]KGN98562.1 hypothetical protein HR11_08500 [Porphyromonas macacae]SUB88406.1 Esterase/lipase [Porphyromonas macacae]
MIARILFYVFILCWGGVNMLFAQQWQGRWQGLLKIGESSLTVVFHIDSTANGFRIRMDSPDQQAYDMQTDSVRIAGDSIFLNSKSMFMSYRGRQIDRDSLSGVFVQGGIFPLGLLRKPRLQEEQVARFRHLYRAEDVSFPGGAERVQLAGTITKPHEERRYPVVILISGSGPQNRDEQVAGHRPFLVLADSLTRAGFLVLRYDDRGVAQSTGNFASATTFDFVNDAEAAIRWLSQRTDVDRAHIYLLGHSEGGLIAQICASKNPESVAGIVLLAAPQVDPMDLLTDQTANVMRLEKKNEEYITGMSALNRSLYEMAADTLLSRDSLKVRASAMLREKFAVLYPEYAPAQLSPAIENMCVQIAAPWFRTFLRIRPSVYLREVRCPILALYGGTDIQVSAESNAAVLRRFAPKSEVHILPGLNHLMQYSGGSTDRYVWEDEVWSPPVLQKIVHTLDKWTKRKKR